MKIIIKILYKIVSYLAHIFILTLPLKLLKIRIFNIIFINLYKICIKYGRINMNLFAA